MKRLEKILVSSILAAVLVASGVPTGVGATVTTTTTGGTTTTTVSKGLVDSTGAAVTEAALAEKVTGVSSKTETTKDDITTTVEVGSVATPTDTATTATTTTDALTAYKVNNSLTGLSSLYELNATVITQETTYKLSYTYTAKKGATNVLTAITSDAKAKLEAVAGKAGTTTEKVKGGTKTTKVEAGALEAKDSNATDATDTDTLNDDATYTVSQTYTVTTTYTITDFSALGYSYDLVISLPTGASVDTDDITILKVDGSTITEVATTIASDGTDKVAYASVTDAGVDYVVAYKTVSKSGALLFGPTTGADATIATVTNGTDTATITNGTAPTDKELTAFTTALTDNNLTKVAYLEITIGSGESYTTSPIEFKIAVPTDLPAVADGYTREYKVLRYHEGSIVVLDTTVADGYIVFSSNLFSDFALAYVDVAADATTTEEATTTDATTEDAATTTATATTTTGTSSTSSTTTKTADNAMIPAVVVSLLLALCAGSVALYKEKKTY